MTRQRQYNLPGDQEVPWPRFVNVHSDIDIGDEMASSEALKLLPFHERIDGADNDVAAFGRFSDYAKLGAYRWPKHGEVAWVLPEGEFIYWRGEVVSVKRADSTASGKNPS